MRLLISTIFGLVLLIGGAHADAQMITKPSGNDVKTTMDRLQAAVNKAGATVFARVDHAGGAAKVDMELQPMEVLIFGNPKLGTPLMQATPEMAIDLPMKVIAWEDDSGQTWIAYTDPGYLKARHGVEGKDKVFETMTGALGKITDVVIQP